MSIPPAMINVAELPRFSKKTSEKRVKILIVRNIAPKVINVLSLFTPPKTTVAILARKKSMVKASSSLDCEVVSAQSFGFLPKRDSIQREVLRNKKPIK